MRSARVAFILACTLAAVSAASAQEINPESRNRLPLLKAGARGVEAIRLHASGTDVRWLSPLGRQLTELAILTSAREHDQPYEWSLHEMEALAVGLDAPVIDIVRNRKPLTGVAGKPAIVIEVGRQVFGKHSLAGDTYAGALKMLGKTDLVDIVSLMGQYAATATRLTAVNQQMPTGWKQLLPLPFTPPADIHPDSRSRLAYIKGESTTPGPLYSRGLAPEGTGPTQIRLHGSGGKTLEANVGRRTMALAVLVTSADHHQPYHWTMSEAAAREESVDAALIDIVRRNAPLNGVADKDAAVIQFGRELFGTHTVSAETYARAVKIFGERNLVDLVDLMARQVSDVTLLTAFDQR